MLIKFGKFHSINDLNLNSASLNDRERKLFKIAIIDDEDFYFKEQLVNLGFNITKYDDVQNLDMLASYDLIISDIKGVGKRFNAEFEGAFLLSQLKKKYPYKEFAAYTGSAYDPRISSLLNGIQVIKKDYPIEDWANAIDSLIKLVGDPKQIWLKIRKDLLDKNVSLIELIYLEDEYVKRVLKNKGFHDFPSSSEVKGLSPEIKNLIMTLSTTLLSKILSAL